jgi:hypothetical protein
MLHPIPQTTIGKLLCVLPLLSLLSAAPSWAVEQPLKAIVNSNQDGIQADAQLTLREAIALLNGTLPLDQLSPTEKAQVQPSPDSARITFNLPPTQTTISLSSPLPDITRAAVIIDGTTQPGYDANHTIGDGECKISTPIVTITPAASVNVQRGLTIAADHVTIQGLSLYGFTMPHRRTASLPPADIFITDRQNQPAQGTVIKDNWLGIAPGESISESTPRSAFGINIFNGKDTVIRNNAIANHDGSGIITGIQATHTQISHNLIQANGKAGMPDAIRLEGVINDTQVTSNWIVGNAGSGVFLFKPEGSVMIQNNTIQFNGRRLRRSAIYLTGSGHQVSHNVITDQPGAGVVVGATPRSDRNTITQNRFARLAGLSIDLNAQLNGGVEAFQRGDGINSRRNSGNRRLETGNGAINAPEFLSSEFFILNGKVNLDGKADPDSQIELYRVSESGSQYGVLSEPIATAETNAEGRFTFTLELAAGDVLSAIATHSEYGTSEPARNVTIRNLR